MYTVSLAIVIASPENPEQLFTSVKTDDLFAILGRGASKPSEYASRKVSSINEQKSLPSSMCGPDGNSIYVRKMEGDQ